MGLFDRNPENGALVSPVGPSVGGGGGSALTVQDEGGTLSAAVTSINFVGAGVTATGAASVTVTIPGGGGITWSTQVDADIIPDGNNTRTLGSSTNKFVALYVNSISAETATAMSISAETNMVIFTDGDLELQPYNSGEIGLKMYSGGSFYTRLAPPVGLAASYTLTLPVDDGTSGQVLSTDGSGALSWVANGGAPTYPLTATAGSAAAPSYSFTGDTDTGIFSSAADTLNFTTGGISRLSISTTAVTSVLDIIPNSTGGASLGTANRVWASVLTNQIQIYQAGTLYGYVLGNTTMPSGATGHVLLYTEVAARNAGIMTESFTNLTATGGAIHLDTGNANPSGAGTATSGQIALKTGNQNTATNGGATGAISLTTGNSAGVGASGSVTLQTGTSTSGTRGSITLNAPTVSLVGNIIPDGSNTRDLGAASFEFANIYVDKIYGVDNCGSRSIDVTSGELLDASAVLCIGWTSRALYNSSGNQRLYWDGTGDIEIGLGGISFNTPGVNATRTIGIQNGAVVAGLTVRTADNAIGASGDLTLETGTASGTRGKIILSGKMVDASGVGGPLRVPSNASDIGTANGDIWYNTTSNELKAYVNGVTVVLA